MSNDSRRTVLHCDSGLKGSKLAGLCGSQSSVQTLKWRASQPHFRKHQEPYKEKTREERKGMYHVTKNANRRQKVRGEYFSPSFQSSVLQLPFSFWWSTSTSQAGICLTHCRWSYSSVKKHWRWWQCPFFQNLYGMGLGWGEGIRILHALVRERRTCTGYLGQYSMNPFCLGQEIK